MDLRRVVSELQRRHVGRVAGVYAVAGWVIIQVVATVFPLLSLPDSAARVLVVLVVVGFPLALAGAWVFDLTPSGLQRTEPLPDNAPIPALSTQHYGRAVAFFGVGILVALVAFAALSRVRGEHTATVGAAGIRSIAVLPFVDMSEKQDQGYFTDGISEELLNRLAQIQDMKVPARTSSFAFRGRNVGISEIGRLLKVQAVLEGSVRRDGNKVRVTARLIDANTEAELWDHVYDREISSIFAIQDEIANDIVTELRLQIDPKPVEAAPGTGNIAANPNAVDSYMKGLALFNGRTDAALRQAVGYFERAVKQDSAFALGHAMLSQAYALLPAYGDFPAFEASSRGQAAAARALQLNPNLAEAYAALGQIRQNLEWDFESAERSYRRAILFNNGYATAHQGRAEALLFLGKTAESESEINAALDLDPASAAVLHVRAYQHLVKREFAAANRILDRILAANPDYPLALISKASVAILTHQAGAANATFARLARGHDAFAAALTEVLAASADPAQRPAAARALASVGAQRAASELALWYALAGLKDDALAQINAAYDSGADANLPFLLLHPAFDSIRGRAEFQKILSELHMTLS